MHPYMDWGVSFPAYLKLIKINVYYTKVIISAGNSYAYIAIYSVSYVLL